MIDIWMKSHLVSGSDGNIENLWCPNIFHKEWDIMLNLHLVFMTQRGQFRISIKQDK